MTLLSKHLAQLVAPIAACLWFTGTSAAVFAADETAGTAAPSTQAEDRSEGAARLVYKPPLRGAPATRVAGGTRGDDRGPLVAVLAPEHTGLTISEQPTLYWFIEKPTATLVAVTLITDSSVDPVLEVELDRAPAAGVNAFRLADYGVRLAPGAAYRWSVALVRNPNERSSDTVTSAAIQRVEEEAALATKLAGASPLDRARELAAAGMWYDLFATVSQLVKDNPTELRYRQLRAALLDQVNLPEVAAHDLAAAR